MDIAVAEPRPPIISNLSGFLQRIEDCNIGREEIPHLTPFLIDGKEIGKLKQRFVQQLLRFNDTFSLHNNALQLTSSLQTCSDRSKAVAAVLEVLHSEGEITGWRDELYPVTSSFYEEPLMLVERAAAVLFGVKAYGVHVNGYVTLPSGIHLWIARRSKTKPNWPGKLDHVVAGGQPHGLSPSANVIKECEEEAGIPAHLAAKARPVSVVSYTTVSELGYKPDVLFCYDIELPPDFKPEPRDGEVEEFMLWPLERVAEIISSGLEFKTNCNLVIIDFLVRHGYIIPEQPGYLQIVAGLRSGDCS